MQNYLAVVEVAVREGEDVRAYLDQVIRGALAPAGNSVTRLAVWPVGIQGEQAAAPEEPEEVPAPDAQPAPVPVEEPSSGVDETPIATDDTPTEPARGRSLRYRRLAA